MGGRLSCECPVEGCRYGIELGLGELSGETYLVARSQRQMQLRAEHPLHPGLQERAGEEFQRPIAVGDDFVLSADQIGNCQDVNPGRKGVMCCLDVGHAGAHIATDGRSVVGIWPTVSP